MKLNLKWVADSIGNDFIKWRKGDTVLISAQTGTGKTWFIKNVLLDFMESYEKLLFVCNRTNLKRQIKNDLLDKFDYDAPDDIDVLDKITTIDGRITIASYHAIHNEIIEEMYGDGSCNFDHYDYVVFDECHFLYADGAFNNKIRLAYERIVNKQYDNPIKIFISATIHEISPHIKMAVDLENEISHAFGNKGAKIHEYNTGIDYSYIKPKYFKRIDNIINLIKNDKSNEKWMIFISDLNVGYKILEELGEDNCSLIKSGTKSDELDSIINTSKFNKKVLVCTKALDNGININDPLLKNMVIMAWDQISFIQMLGRKRINIENADQVNLFIQTRYKKAFKSKLQGYNDKMSDVNLREQNPTLFYKKYDNDLKDFSERNDIFYRDGETGEIEINPIGKKRLIKDIEFAEYMINRFGKKNEFAFIHEQLSWLGLSDSSPSENLIEDVVSYDEVRSLEKYLDSISGKKLFEDGQLKLSNLIIRQLITISKNVDYRTEKLKPSTLENIIREQLNLPYAVSKSIPETKGEMRNKRYIIITKITTN